MIIKTFTADSVAAALKKVRQEMGGGATVLRTRQVRSGFSEERIEITACLDSQTSVSANVTSADSSNQATFAESGSPQSTLQKPATEVNHERFFGVPTSAAEKTIKRVEHKLDRLLNLNLHVQPELSRSDKLSEISRHLKEADLPDAYLEHLLATLLDEYDGQQDILSLAKRKLVTDLLELVAPIPDFQPGDKLLFIGPAGAGKSSVMAKLATRLVLRQKRKVRLASLDFQRVAAYEELAGYAEILQTDVAGSPEDIENSSPDSDSILLIDTPSWPTNSQKLGQWIERIEKAKPNYRLAVFSALTRSRDIEQIAVQLRKLTPTHLVMTMLDLTACCGSVVAGAGTLGIRLAMITNAPGGQGEVHAPSPTELAQAMLRTGRNLSEKETKVNPAAADIKE
jgi:flagellar biosynthesis protein FlhF